MPEIELPERQELSPAFRQPPEQLHRGYVELAYYPDSAPLKEADEAFRFVWDTLDADNAFRITRDPQDTLAGHANKVRQQIGRSSQERARKIDTAKSALKTEPR